MKSLTRFSSSLVAFLNAYGYLRFGQEGFERKSDRFSIPNKLAQMLRQPFGQTFEDGCEIAGVVAGDTREDIPARISGFSARAA